MIMAVVGFRLLEGLINSLMGSWSSEESRREPLACSHILNGFSGCTKELKDWI